MTLTLEAPAPDLAPGEVTHWLRSDDDFSESVLAGVFGHMVTTATPVIESHHGDLFHDAGWLREHVTGPCTFYWIIRNTGAYIGMSRKDVRLAHSIAGGDMYRLRLTHDRSRWELHIRRLTPPDQAERARLVAEASR